MKNVLAIIFTFALFAFSASAQNAGVESFLGIWVDNEYHTVYEGQPTIADEYINISSNTTNKDIVLISYKYVYHNSITKMGETHSASVSGDVLTYTVVNDSVTVKWTYQICGNKLLCKVTSYENGKVLYTMNQTFHRSW